MAPIHDRMPVMLAPQQYTAWLARDQQDPASLTPLLGGIAEDAMQAWPVGKAVGRASNQGPALVEPVEPLPAQT